MSRKILIRFGYSAQVVLDAEVALKVSELLDGNQVVETTYMSHRGELFFNTGELFSTNLRVLDASEHIYDSDEVEAMREEQEREAARLAALEGNADAA